MDNVLLAVESSDALVARLVAFCDQRTHLDAPTRWVSVVALSLVHDRSANVYHVYVPMQMTWSKNTRRSTDGTYYTIASQ